MLLIEGLAGIGKTRFLEEVQNLAREQGMDVYTGYSDEFLNQPYAPFAGLLARFEAAQVLDESDMTSLRRFFGVAGLSHPISLMDEVKQDQVQFRLALSRGLIALARRQPLLLIVEDLHTADQPSLEAFAYLAFVLAAQRPVPLLLVGSYRPVTSGKASLGQVLGLLCGEPIVRTLELSGLEEAETRELLQQLSVARPTQYLVRTFQEQTHGVPLFIEQAVHHALASGALYERGGYLSVDPSAVSTWRLPQTQVEPAIASWQVSLTAARTTGDPILQMLRLTNLPLAYNLQGALQEGEAIALEGADIANLSQYWSEHSKAISHLTSIAAAKGQFTSVARYAQDTMVMVERSRYPWSGFRALSALAYASAARGRWDEVSQALDTLVTPGCVFASPSPFIRVYTRVFRQLILAYGSQLLTERIGPLHDELMEVVTQDTYSLAPLCAMIELSDLCLMPEYAERPAEMLAVAMERGVMIPVNWIRISRSDSLVALNGFSFTQMSTCQKL
ncbi:ATP-binding protein [Candidatus Entotheonella palauensis]|uniref:ATP-binding protein n=1 Tax=Candidatus Entotheonella palauensis TaxID=93172 RepID=UPI000B7E3335|nr:AAA family ATPase [Candidatus Entotheonella palauensis]